MKYDVVPDKLLLEMDEEEGPKTGDGEVNSAIFPQKMINDLTLHSQNLSNADTLRELLCSAALEETAIAHLIHAQANKIEAFTGRDNSFPTSPTNQQINDFQNGIARVFEAMVEKQKQLIRMIEISKRLLEQDDLREG
ncbi:hypothetical protein [Paenibacillus sp. FJAT-26967]|uniref:hypothetical protein n=1 Tax=Paenibacillus sp. FJAT-26967 TaxID=1729690 RepID=UPI00083903D8|nr:hypothetical protein [Paenibacillus sp. FJAT-26967]